MGKMYDVFGIRGYNSKDLAQAAYDEWTAKHKTSSGLDFDDFGELSPHELNNNRNPFADRIPWIYANGEIHIGQLGQMHANLIKQLNQEGKRVGAYDTTHGYGGFYLTPDGKLGQNICFSEPMVDGVRTKSPQLLEALAERKWNEQNRTAALNFEQLPEQEQMPFYKWVHNVRDGKTYIHPADDGDITHRYLADLHGLTDERDAGWDVPNHVVAGTLDMRPNNVAAITHFARGKYQGMALEKVHQDIQNFINTNHPGARIMQMNKVAKKEDPDYAFVYFNSGLELVPWEHNIRFDDLADNLLKKFNMKLEDSMDMDGWTGGTIIDRDGEAYVTFKQLAPPEVQNAALRAIKATLSDDDPTEVEWSEL